MDDKSDTPDKPDYLGHRDRLRQRFVARGADTLDDYELLELVLFGAIPRQDTKPIAKALLRRFGSYAGVLRARPEALQEVKGVGKSAAVAIAAIGEAARRLAREEVLEQPVLSSWEKVIDYLRIELAQEKTEQFRVLFLDSKNRLIGDEQQQKGTVNHTPVYPREVIKRALEMSATAIIMVHNHPSGDPAPSKADIAMTKEIRDVGKALGVILHDHVIIGKSGHSSFRSMGLI